MEKCDENEKGRQRVLEERGRREGKTKWRANTEGREKMESLES
jgi:hypothetical protein